MEEIIKRIYPEYANVWEIFENTERMYCCNMFIADKAFINNYRSWLFTIMIELEEVIKKTVYPHQKRIFGFIAERLIDLYLLNNNINVAEFPVLELK